MNRYEDDFDVDVEPARTVSHDEQLSTGMVKRANNFVPAKPKRSDPTAVQRMAASVTEMATNGEVDSQALASLATNIETSRPVERALATGIRLLAVITIVLIAAWSVGVVTESEPLMFTMLAVGAIAAVVWIVRTDNRHSPAGIEHGKIDGYVTIRHAEIESQERIIMAKLGAFSDVAKKVYGASNDDD